MSRGLSAARSLSARRPQRRHPEIAQLALIEVISDEMLREVVEAE
jgi:hypothetical protein